MRAVKPNTEYTVKVEVTERENNSDFVSVWFKITDGAGNVKYVRTENYLVNCTNPVLESITIDGVLHDDAIESYYNDKRTATLVIIDRASSFDEVAATNGISISAKDANGEIVSTKMIRSNIEWNSDGNRHVATIVFEKDANYEWEVSYINKAGKTLNKDDVEETGNSIYSRLLHRCS